MKRLFKLLVRFVVLAGLIGAAFVAAIRAKFPPVVEASKRLFHDVVNPETMKTAGQPGADASVVRHRGRSTGTEYETPVMAVPTDDGFVIPLAYGTESDWFQNVQAAGSAVIVKDGMTVTVDHPEVIDAEAAEGFVSEEAKKMAKFFGIDDFLRVDRAGDDDTREEVGASS